MTDYYFEQSEENPCEVLIVISGRPFHYHTYPISEVAKAVVEGQNRTER